MIPRLAPPWRTHLPSPLYVAAGGISLPPFNAFLPATSPSPPITLIISTCEQTTLSPPMLDHVHPF